jgi:hypothetical protein
MTQDRDDQDVVQAATSLRNLVGELGANREPEALLAALVTLRRLRERLNEWEPELISAARDRGVSWTRLAPALGVTSRQAAERRYLRLRRSPGGEPTAEGRVRAVRERRAGDRAVAAWAQQNAASLRQLAGEVSAVAGLTGPGRRQVGLVREALADNDPAALLSPLDEAHAHLEAGHTDLAARIGELTRHAEHVREQTRAQRAETSKRD